MSIGDIDIKLDYPIKDTIEIYNVIVVLMDPPSEIVENRNVVAFNKDGSYNWRIERSTDIDRNNPYMKINIHSGDLIVETWDGMRYNIDIETGEILSGNLRK